MKTAIERRVDAERNLIAVLNERNPHPITIGNALRSVLSTALAHKRGPQPPIPFSNHKGFAEIHVDKYREFGVKVVHMVTTARMPAHAVFEAVRAFASEHGLELSETSAIIAA